MNNSNGDQPFWVDHGVTPPLCLPAQPEAIATYLATALGHPVYEHWTWRRLVQVYGALPDARRAKPRVCRLLIDAPAVIEAWQRGRLHIVPETQAPGVAQVVLALLKTHARRFKACADSAAEIGVQPMSVLPVSLASWLQRTGRLHNPHPQTNTLGAADDHGALAAFLRERASRSPHTWRAYTGELERLALWCSERGLGPLSDLTRQNLLAYQAWLRHMPPPSSAATRGALGERSQARALAVVASLFRYWHDTGYLLGNPAAGLSGGGRSRVGFAPTRFVPAALLRHCDEWVAHSVTIGADLARWRRAAVWVLYRYSGTRLAELAWSPGANLPRLEVDEQGGWQLTVLGKGDKERSIPLPRACGAVLQAYRLARGLPAQPDPVERMPPVHGEKGGHLGSRGLYDEVKAVLLAVASEVEPCDAAGAVLLRTVSPHWLRHAYARTLIVDKRVPLPAAQALLGHASVQTTAAYAKTDLSQLREFVDAGFGLPAFAIGHKVND